MFWLTRMDKCLEYVYHRHLWLFNRKVKFLALRYFIREDIGSWSGFFDKYKKYILPLITCSLKLLLQL